MSGDLYFNNVSLLSSFNGSHGLVKFVDDSLSPKQFTASGNAAISTAFSYFGGSSLYIPSGSYLTGPISNDFVFDTDDFTIEFWYYHQNSATSNCAILCNKSAAGTAGWHIDAYADALMFSAANGTITTGLASGVPQNVWTHYAFVRSGSTLRTFKNGIIVHTNSSAGALNITELTTLYVGKLAWSAATFVGYIDELRITKGIARYTANFLVEIAPFARGRGQITGSVKDITNVAAARYVNAYSRRTGALLASNFTCEADPYYQTVVAHLHFDGVNQSSNIVDSSYLAASPIAYENMRLSTDTSKFGGSSLRFPGVNNTDYVWIGTNNQYSILGGPSTLEFQINLTTYNTSGGRIIAAGGGTAGWNSTTGIHWLLQVVETGLAFYWWTTGTSNGSITIPIVLGVWTHVAFSYNGTTLFAFIDGVLYSSTAITPGIPSSVPTLTLGLIYGDVAGVSTYVFNGYLDELRISKGVCRYTTSFTPPNYRHPDRSAIGLGDFSFSTPTLDPVTVICLDDDANADLNSIVFDRIIPT